MLEASSIAIWCLVLSFIFSLVGTDLVRRLSQRWGFVYRPQAHRWNKRTVALGGGVAVFFSIGLGLVSAGLKIPAPLLWTTPFIFVLGLWDDRKMVSPWVKLFIQAACAAYLALNGFSFPSSVPWLGEILSFGWIVVLTNSMNIIDNMDGLAGGVYVLIAVALYFMLDDKTPSLAFTTAAIAGANIGFLFHNFYPAKIFMGDAGSLTSGFLLSSLATQVRPTSDPSSLVGSVVLAGLIFLVPVFDSILVSYARKTSGRLIMSGGKDHTSHRLVALGSSDSKAVMKIYALGAAGSVTAWTLSAAPLTPMLILFALLASLLGWLAWYLLRVPVYPEQIKSSSATAFSFVATPASV